jgi:predicted Zn-dependent peptidase
MNRFKQHVFPQGLKLITIPVPGVKSVTALLLVRAGTRHEKPETNGISHFLEHMVFKGTLKYPTALDISTAVDELGAEFNAFTGKEYTGFYVKSAAQHVERAVDVVCQLVFGPKLAKKDLEVERGVILEEIRMYEDQPMAKVGKEFETLLYSNTALGWETVGKPENIRSLAVSDFVAYRNSLYQPSRMVLALAGNPEAVGNREAGKIIKTYLDKVNQVEGPKEERFIFHQPTPALRLVEKKTEQAHLCLGVRAYAKGDKRRYAAAVLAGLLGGGMSSRLFQEIREKRGLAYYVKADVQAYTDNGYLVMQAGTEPKNVREVIQVALQEFAKISAGRFMNSELTKAKEYLKGQFILSLEDSQAVADHFGEDLLLEGKVRTPGEILTATDQVTKAQVQKVAREIFVNSGLNLAVISPKINEEQMEKSLRF